MIGRGAGLVAVAAGMALAAPALAQQQLPQSGGAEIDPSAPLDPLPDLGVEWPDLNVDPLPPVGSESTETAARPNAVDDAAAERRYAWDITGLGGAGDDELLKEFREASTLKADEEQEANAAQMDRRARADAELLTELLRARGYYDASVEPLITSSQTTIRVTLAARPGEQYRFTEVSLLGLEEAGEDAAELRRSFTVQAGDPVDAKRVIAAGLNLQVALGQRGFALARVGEQDVLVDHQTRTARLVLPVEPGPVQTFGQIRVTGQPPFSAAHVGTIARFKTGDRYRKSGVDDLRRALVATGLVAAAEVKVTPAADRRTVDLDVHLQPAPMRTIAGELGYGTGEGARAEASWHHRNFFNPEGALTLRAVAGTQEQLAGASLRFNNWRQRDQVLTLGASASHVDRNAFEAKTVQLLATVERQSNLLWQKPWTWSFGAELLASGERDVIASTAEDRRRTFLIAAVPASLNHDATDDLLDPTRGFRLGGRISPELSLQDGGFGYARMQVDGSAYRPVAPNIVAAGRVRLGTIAGASRDRIAPSRRFYAGGGGSVRGYGYQQLGPRDADGDPIGGRSLAEFSLEARARIGDFGFVPFLDGGALSTSALPKLNGWQFGTGIGFRYFSSFGPIRVDVGTPLNRREGDNRIAVTVSLGQAF